MSGREVFVARWLRSRKAHHQLPEPVVVIPKVEFLGATGYLVVTLPEDTPAERVQKIIDQIRASGLPAERTFVICGAQAEIVDDFQVDPKGYIQPRVRGRGL